MIPDTLAPIANHLWQSTLFAIVVWFLTLILRKNRAAVRHRLWLAASLKFLVPFSLLASVGTYFQASAPPVGAPASVSMVVESISQPFGIPDPPALDAVVPLPESNWIPVTLATAWALGFAASLFWWAFRWRQVGRAMREATSLNLDVPIRVLSCADRFEPGVFGIFRPVLLLPHGIADRLSPAQLKAVIAHELTHVRRRDNLAAALHMFVEAVFWFHPLIWWIKARLIEEQERACDEEVLRLGGDPQAYAESILKICEFCVTSPLMCVSGITGSDLKKRIEGIMRHRMELRLSIGKTVLLAVVGIAVLAVPITAGILASTATPIEPQVTLESTPAVEIAAPPQTVIQAAAVTVRPSKPRPAPQVSAAKRLEFEAVSLKPNLSGPRTRLLCRGVDGVFSASGPTARMVGQSTAETVPQGRCVGNNVTLRDVIMTAYGLPFSWRIANADDWPDLAVMYQLEAKAENAGAATSDELRQMLQAFLADRLKLKVRRSTQEAQGYAVVVSKDGSRLQQTTGIEGYLEPSSQASASRSLHGKFRMRTFAELMTDYIGGGAAVVDMTGLPGLYEIHLVLNRVGGSGGVRTPEGPEPGTNLGLFDPPLFKAIEQQLGLRLEARKVPVETLVIDHMEKPAEN